VGPQEVTPAPKELVKLLNDLKSADKKVRAKTIRILHGKLVGHPMATRHPDLVPLAAELARTLPEVESRCVCVSLLTDITPDGPVPEWLMTALGDTDQSVQWAALYAIHWFKGPELVDLVIKIVRNVMNPLFAVSAADSLSEFPDARAIPELAALLERTLPSEVPVPAEMHDRFYEQQYTRIALALAKYGVPAVSKLTALLGHADRNRRFAAIVGLRAIGEAESRKAVAALKSDTDAGVRDQAEICDAIWGNAPGFEMHEMK